MALLIAIRRPPGHVLRCIGGFQERLAIRVVRDLRCCFPQFDGAL